jgi:hypothetical protein
VLKTYNISLDLETKTSPKSFTVNQNDLNTLEVNITITSNKKPLDITGMTPRIVIKKPSYLTVIQDCEIVSAVTGSIKVVLNTQAYSEAGSHTGEVYLYEGDNVLVTETFSYTSNKAILNDNAFKSSNDWQSINDAFIKIDDGINRIENADVYSKTETVAKLDSKSSVGHTHAYSEITGKPTTFPPTAHSHAISEVSGLQSSLDDKATQTALNTTNANVTANTNAIGLKADKTYVDTQLADLASQNNYSVIPTYTNGQLTKVEEKDGSVVKASSTITYNTDGTVDTVTEVLNGKTVVSKLNYVNGEFSTVTRTVL